MEILGKWVTWRRSLDEFNERYAPVYDPAIARVIRNIISRLNRRKERGEEFRILVIDGGASRFSKERILEGIKSNINSVAESVHCSSLKGYASPFPFQNKRFNLVVSERALHTLTPKELEIALGEIKRVLKPGAALVNIEDFHGGNTYSSWELMLSASKPPFSSYQWKQKSIWGDRKDEEIHKILKL